MQSNIQGVLNYTGYLHPQNIFERNVVNEKYIQYELERTECVAWQFQYANYYLQYFRLDIFHSIMVQKFTLIRYWVVSANFAEDFTYIKYYYIGHIAVLIWCLIFMKRA